MKSYKAFLFVRKEDWGVMFNASAGYLYLSVQLGGLEFSLLVLFVSLLRFTSCVLVTALKALLLLEIMTIFDLSSIRASFLE